MTVLFTSSRPIGRCENVTAVYEAYRGPKRFAQLGYGDSTPYEGCSVVVSDECLQRKRPDQVLVHIGHGLTGIKRYGLDQRNGVYRPECTWLVDYYVCSSEQTRPYAASGVGIPIERCLPLGMPRADAYVGKRKGDGGTFLAKFERAYLFAPTFRARWEPSAPRIDWAALDAQLEDDEILVVKRHMVTRNPIAKGQFAHIAEVDSSEPSTPYLIDCDVLVTDYSSIALDAHVLGKPAVAFVPDLLEYEDSRGFYRRYPEDYFKYSANLEWALLHVMRGAVGDSASAEPFREFYGGACDGHSTERVCDLIGEILDGRR